MTVPEGQLEAVLKAGRRAEPLVTRDDFARDLGRAWSVFSEWCTANHFRPFPASVRTVLRFLLAHEGDPLLCGYWRAIDVRHDSEYWDSNLNPTMFLRTAGIGCDSTGRFKAPAAAVRAILEDESL